MKRLNPLTNEYFKKGDIREDGYIFWSYQPSTIKRDGYFKEKWYSPKSSKLLKEQHKRLNTEYRTTCMGRAKRLFASAKKRAKIHNMPFDLSLDDIFSRIQNGCCELTKLSFSFLPPNNTYTNPYAPSIDRIDSSKGYTKDNVRIILSGLNIAINDHGLKTMLPIFEALLKVSKPH